MTSTDANSGTWKFRKPRGSRACEVCRYRKVRCNAETQMPCSNCKAFGCECKFPELKKRRRYSGPIKNSNDFLTNRVNEQLEQEKRLNSYYPQQLPYNYSLPTGQNLTVPQGMDNQYGTINSTNTSPVNQVPPSFPMPISQQPIYAASYYPYSAYITPPVQGNMVSPQGPKPPSVQTRPPGNPNEVIRPPNIPKPQIDPKPPSGLPPLSPWDIDNEYFIPNDPCANISMTDLTPEFDKSDFSIPSNGLKIANRSEYSKMIYHSAPSYYQYFAPDVETVFSSKVDDPTSKPENQLTAQDIQEEIEILKIKGAFKLPSKFICRQLISAFFEHFHPHAPIVEKESFLKHFDHPDIRQRPPLILIQVILLSGLKLCKHPAVLDSDGSVSTANKIMYKRVKALIDTSLIFEYVGNYKKTGDIKHELDDGYVVFNYPTTILQAQLLLSMYWDGPEDFTKGPYFWLRSGVLLAFAYGLHSDMKNSKITSYFDNQFHKYCSPVHQDKFEAIKNRQFFVWRKIFWFMYSRDILNATAFGRPILVDLKQCNVQRITMEDYEMYEYNWKKTNTKDYVEAQYYVNQLKLAEVMAFVVRDQYLMINEKYKLESYYHRLFCKIKQINLLMGLYLKELPSFLRYSIDNPNSKNIFALVLAVNYFGALYHINRIRLTDKSNTKFWGISYQSIYMISHIGEVASSLKLKNPSILIPGTMVYNISLAIVFLEFHVESNNLVVKETSEKQLKSCLKALDLVQNDWKGIIPVIRSFVQNKKTDPKVAERAKNLLIKENSRIQEVWTTMNYIRPLEINALLNSESDNDTLFKITKKEYEDPDLPFSTILTYDLPPYDDEFFQNFESSQLFSPVLDKYDGREMNSGTSSVSDKATPDTSSTPVDKKEYVYGDTPCNVTPLIQPPIETIQSIDNQMNQADDTYTYQHVPLPLNYSMEGIDIFDEDYNAIFGGGLQAREIVDEHIFLNLSAGLNWK